MIALTAGDVTRNTVGTLIISPTRELATQIANESIKLTTHHKEMETRLLVGGANRRLQLRDWMRGRLDVVVATPGRLRDLISDARDGEAIREHLSTTNMLVLDEADTLLDMGFTDDLNFIISHLPKERQTFLFSATVSPAIKAIARKSLHPEHRVIDCVPANESNVHLHIPQYQAVLPSASEQLPHVLRLLAHDQLTNPGMSKSIVFLPTTKLTMLYATFIRELSESLPMGQRTQVYEIHSKLDQDKRSRASARFREDKSGAGILVTSDVSARGVDYPGVTRVIQVGIPGSAEQYIHRVGRTGRGGVTTGRGDLVLLPWEMGFLTWQLTKIPIKSAPVEEVKAEVAAMTEKFDANPTAAIEAKGVQLNRVDNRGRPFAAVKEYAPRLAVMEENIAQLQSGLDEEAVGEVFTSMLGYYLGKTGELRTSHNVVLEGLKDWAVQAGGLAQPPHLSAAFLQKLGVKDGRTGAGRFGSKGGMSGNWGRAGGERSFGRASEGRPWEGRGSRSSREGGSYGGREGGSYGGREGGSYGGREGGFGGRREGGREGGFQPRY